ncbi:sensor histidine kinase [Crassaminicella indica]|uniref:GHKL domain-containing protein n=1 Tax=Crassaminicella indica TaxID=2855394 RepID=A0ABX8RB07_9CLOT|nr:GHKL domain-containing protein [Crassaminicella indica]QXM06233.1 GHKL domain-containing protein [Crassaminicella indica]
MKIFNIYMLIITILLQLTVILMFNTSIETATSLENLKRCIPFFNLLIMILTFFVIFSIKKINEYRNKEIENKLLKTYLSNVESILTLFRKQRHSYINHIQTIKSMSYLEEYNDLIDYLEGISEEYRNVSELIRVGNPALTALLNIKKEIAEKKGVNVYIKCKYKTNFEWIRPWDLCDMVGNLIDNAIEGATILTNSKKWIKVKIDKSENKYILQIENTGKLDKNIPTEELFKAGISTKNATSRGYGLYIVKQIVEKYHGTVSIEETEDETVLVTLVLIEGVQENVEKII